MELDQFTQQLLVLLTELTNSTNTDQLQAITNELNKNYFSRAQSIPALLEIYKSSPQWTLRQLAAVELRKRINKLWIELPSALREPIKAVLLEQAVNETNMRVRHCIARVISAVAELEVPENRWNDLVSFIVNTATSPIVACREVGVYVLLTLFEVIADFLEGQLPQLFALLSKTLVDPESRTVRVTTLEVLGSVAEYVDSENKRDVKYMQELVPGMVAVLKECIDSDNEEAASKGFEVFDIMLSLEAPLLNIHLAAVVEFCVGVSTNTNISTSIRLMSLSLLMLLPMYKRTRLTKLRLIEPVLTHIFPIGREASSEDPDEDAPAKLAYRVINSFSTHLPPQFVFPVMSRMIESAAHDADPLARKAAMMSLAMLVDGCADFMRPHTDELVQLIAQCMRDPAPVVRRAACMALVSFTEHLDDEVCSQHALLVPIIIELMNDTTIGVQRQACNALDALLESLGSDVKQYIEVLMQKLIHLLDNSEVEVRQTVVAAIGSAAHSLKRDFRQYFEVIYPRLHQMMTLTGSNDDHILRAMATDSISAVAEAVGVEMFRPYVPLLMQIIFDGLKLNAPRLHECSFCFFGVLSRTFGAEFSPYLTSIMPILLESIGAEEYKYGDTDGNNEAEQDISGSEVGDDNEEEDEEDSDGFNIMSAVADEKEAAIHCLGEVFEATTHSYMPFMEQSITALLPLADHFSEAVRKSVIGTLFRFVFTYHKMSEPQDWTPGLPLKVPIHDNVQQMITITMDTTVKIFAEEEDRVVCIDLCEDLAASLRQVGPALLGPNVDKVANLILSVLEKKHLCQQNDDGEDAELDEQELAEWDAMLISAASDVVGSYAAVLGPTFAPYAHVFIPHIIKFYKENKPVSERSMAIGCLGEIASGLAEGVDEFTKTLYPLFLRALRDEAAEVRSNAAFGLGSLIGGSTLDMSSEYMNVLTALRPLFDPQSLVNATDNAAGAIARMILKNPEAVPLTQVVPVLVAALPLQADFTENTSVYRCIMSLFQTQHQFMMQYLPQIITAIGVTITAQPEQVKETTRVDLITFVRQLCSDPSTSATVSQVLSTLNSDIHKALQQIL